MIRIRRKKTLKTFIAVVVVLIGLWVSITSVLNLWGAEKQLDDLRGEVMALRDEDHELKKSEEYKEDSLYIEKQARDKLNLIRPDEKIIDISGDVDGSTKNAKRNSSEISVSARELWVLLFSGGLN